VWKGNGRTGWGGNVLFPICLISPLGVPEWRVPVMQHLPMGCDDILPIFPSLGSEIVVLIYWLSEDFAVDLGD
jgi:hypothetical protein